MRDPQKEVERLLKNPIHTAEGSIFINRAFKRPSIQLDLNSFSGRPHGSLFMLSSEEWIRVVKIMKVYFARGKKNSKKKGGSKWRP